MESNHNNLRHKRRKLAHEDMATPQTEGATDEKHVNDLPDEVLAKILGYLPRHDLVRNASAVCWRWHEAAFDQDNWRTIDVCIGDKMSVQDLRRLVKKSTKKLRITLDENVLDGTFKTVLEKSDTLRTLILNMQKPKQDSSNTDLAVKKSTRASSRLALTSIGQHCGENLRKLVLYKIDGLNNRILISILRSCNNLDMLSIAYCKNLSTSVLSVIGENASQLTKLVTKFSKDKRLSKCSIENLVVRCPMLKVLDISACFSIHTDWKCIGKLCHVRVLLISNIDVSAGSWSIDDDTIIHWIKHCRQLKYLSIPSPLMTDKALKVIALSKLRRFDMLISSGITPQGLEFLAKNTTLEKICMQVLNDSITVVANDIVQFWKSLKTLKELRLQFGHFTHPLRKQLAKLKRKGVYPISFRF